MYNYLCESGLTTVHAHNFNDKVLKMNELLSMSEAMPENKIGSFFFTNARYRIVHAILKNNPDADIRIFISLREPVAYLKSMYCQYWDWFSVITTKKYGKLTPDNFGRLFNENMAYIEKLVDKDIDQFELETLIISSSVPAHVRLTLYIIYNYIFWFENELFSMFDIAENDLEYENGFWSFENKNIKGSIIKLEDFDASLESSLENLLELSIDSKVESRNISSDKEYTDYYSLLKSDIKIPNKIVDFMKSSFSYEKFYGHN